MFVFSSESKVLTSECVEEMRVARWSLMEDVWISSDLISACEAELTSRCDGYQSNFHTVHCLMRLARESERSLGNISVIRDACTQQVKNRFNVLKWKFGQLSSTVLKQYISPCPYLQLIILNCCFYPIISFFKCCSDGILGFLVEQSVT